MRRCLLFFSFSVIWILFCHSQNLRGIDPNQINRYGSTVFRCFSGHPSIPISAVNDDYCDCEDGSDEPGTSACRNGQFYCSNDGHVPLTIFSSRVNDGICDCCDGSDEYISSSCPNTCQRAWEESTKQLRIEIQEHETGLEFVKRQQLGHQEKIQSKKALLEEKKAAKTTLQPIVDALNSQKSEIQSKIDSKTQEIKDSVKDEVEEETNRQFLERQIEKEKEKEDQTSEEQEHPHPEYDEHQPMDEPINSNPTQTELSEEEKQRQAEEDRNRIRNKIVDSKLEENHELNALKEEQKSIEENYNSKQRELSEIDSTISEIEKFLSFDFGESATFGYLDGESISFVTGDYTYTLNPFKEVTQGHTKVGYWGQWRNNYREMFYDRGERCWGGPDRSIVVSLSCGASNEILEVKEPAKCEYFMKLKTPGACDEKSLEELKKRIKNKN